MAKLKKVPDMTKEFGKYFGANPHKKVCQQMPADLKFP